MKSAAFKEELRSLHADRRNTALAGLLVTHAAWVTSVAIAVSFPSAGTIAFAFLLVGLMQYRIAMSCHEAVHYTLLSPRGLNECVGLVHCSMVGLNFARYRRQHNAHHGAHGIAGDPDAYIYEPVLRARAGLPRVLKWLGGTCTELVEKLRQKGLSADGGHETRRLARKHSLAIIVTQGALFAMFTVVSEWWTYFLLWVLPLLTIAVFLNRSRVIIEHCLPHMVSGLAPEEVDDADQLTVDVLTNPVERFFLAPFSFNYHYAHHRIHTVPHYNAARLSELLDRHRDGGSHRVSASYFTLMARILLGERSRERQVQAGSQGRAGGPASHAACHLCSGRSAHLVVEGPDFEYACEPGHFRLVRCADCGHVFADPMPSAEEIPDLYPPTYYTVNPESPLYLRGFVGRAKVKRDVRRLLKLFAASGPRSLVDIGCGNAARLFRLRELFGDDVELVGLDLAYEAGVLRDAASLGVRLVEGNVEADLTALADGGHDFIIMSQLIEHLRQPRAVLEALRGKLDARGRLLIETPSLEGLDYRLFRRRYWGGYHIPRHLHLFTRASLAKLVESCGYRIVRRGSLPSPGFWIISLRNWAGLNSIRRGRSLFEFLNFGNLSVVCCFTALDLALSGVGLPTSNQYLLAERR